VAPPTIAEQDERVLERKEQLLASSVARRLHVRVDELDREAVRDKAAEKPLASFRLGRYDALVDEFQRRAARRAGVAVPPRAPARR
jgi:hypothetical protein